MNNFDNSNINDGRNRVEVPKSRKSGGKFTWGKCVIFAVILLMAIVYTVLVIVDSKEVKISEKEWIYMLTSELGSYGISEQIQNCTDKPVTGQYAAVTVMRVVGKQNLPLLTGKDVITDADLITLAANLYIVDGTLMTKKLTEDDANEILEQAKDFYYDPIFYPVFNNNQIKPEVVESYEVELVSMSPNVDPEEKGRYAVISYPGVQGSEAIQDGTIMLIEVSPGVTEAFTVYNAEETEEGDYSVVLEEVEESSEVFELVDFSGVVDFNYVFNEGATDHVYLLSPSTVSELSELSAIKKGVVASANKNSGNTKETRAEIKARKAEEKAAKKAAKAAEKEAKKKARQDKWQARREYWSDLWESWEEETAINEDFKSTVDLEMGGKLKAAYSTSDGAEFAGSRYGKFSSTDENGEKQSITYEVSASKDAITLSIAGDNFTLEDEIATTLDADDDDDDDFEAEGSVEGSITYKVAVNNLSIVGATYFQTMDWDDPENFVDLRISADVELEALIEGEIEGKIPIFKYQYPIPVTGGAVTVDMNMFLVVTLSGEVHFTYEIEDVHASFNASKDGMVVDAGVGDKRTDINMKTTLEVGPDIQVGMSILTIPLIDPTISLRVGASVETLPKREGYEDYPKCLQSNIYFPTLEVEFIGEDNAINLILGAFGHKLTPTYTFLDDENAPVQVPVHIERDKDTRKWSFYKGLEDEVCTHILGNAANPANGDIDGGTGSNGNNGNGGNGNTGGSNGGNGNGGLFGKGGFGNSTGGMNLDDDDDTQEGYNSALVERMIDEFMLHVVKWLNEFLEMLYRVFGEFLENWMAQNCDGCC